MDNPGCNVSSSMRANPAPSPVTAGARGRGRVTSASSGAARARAGCPPSSTALQHCRMVPKTLGKLRGWGRTQQQQKLGRSRGLLQSHSELRHKPGDGVRKSATAELCSFLLGQSPKVLLSSWTVIKHLVAVPCLQPAASASLALLTRDSLGA